MISLILLNYLSSMNQPVCDQIQSSHKLPQRDHFVWEIAMESKLKNQLKLIKKINLKFIFKGTLQWRFRRWFCRAIRWKMVPPRCRFECFIRRRALHVRHSKLCGIHRCCSVQGLDNSTHRNSRIELKIKNYL